MRTIPQLYELLDRHFPALGKDPIYNYIGFCDVISRMQYQHHFLTHEEYTVLLNDLKANRPTQSKHSEFYGLQVFPGYWWPVTASGYRTRIAFIKHMIQFHERARQ